MPRFAAAMDGSGPYEVVLYTSNSGTTVNTTLYWQRVGSVGYSSWSGGASYNITIGGVSVASGGYNFNAPSGGPIGETWIANGSRNVGAVGSVTCAGYFNSDTSGAGYGAVSGNQSVATVPPPPTNMPGTPDQITTRGMRYQFNSAGDGGSAIIRWEYECWPTGGAPTGVGASSGTTTRNDLLPGTEWNWHARGVNALGAGGWSAIAKGTTSAASASTMVVTASIQGTSATLTPTLSPTMPAVDTWLVERRLAGTTTPVTPYSFSGSSYTATGLAQGAIYEWRVAAKLTQNGVSYTSPWSAWQAVQQPNPNTSPGTYFDGNTAPTGEATYSWDGTANNSRSSVRAKDVRGWALIANDGLGVLYRQIGGRSGSYAARVLCTADASGPNALIFASNSENWTQIAERGVYTASFYVQVPKRSQRMAAYIIWRDSLTAPIGAPVVGAGVVVGPNPGAWTRVSVTAQAPAGAVYADVQLYDVAGAGFSRWLGGDYWIVDDAMVALGTYEYFDGNTPDDGSFTYDWLGTPDASSSAAYPVSAADQDDPLADPDCPPIPQAPLPPSIDDECIDEVGTWRRYWAIIPREEVRQWLTVVPTMVLTTGNLPARQVRIRVFANPDQLPPDQFVPGDWEAEQIISYIPAQTALTLDGISRRVWASVKGGDSMPADRLLFGTGGGPASWPLLRCGTAYLIAFDVPLDAPDGNLSTQVTLTTRAM